MKYFVPFIACLLLVAGIFSRQALAEAIVLTLLWLFVCFLALYEPKVTTCTTLLLMRGAVPSSKKGE